MMSNEPEVKKASAKQGEGVPIPLESVDLLKPIGYGGVAQVWGGRHRSTGVAVAIKVLTGRPAKDPDFVAGFHREIHTVAGLDHPAIVMLLDHGSIPEAVALKTGGRLMAGSPYLVMELSTEGTLTERIRRGPMPWGEIKPVLLDLLDALGHAHARGLIHRDIKPDNVLGFSDATALWRLSDFGIAHALEEVGGDSDRVMGTPGYMAPEQVRGDFRDYGPWTDLYAFGCLAYYMIWGRLPYPFAEAQRYIYAQLESAAPRLPLPMGMPRGLDTWVHRLLDRDPAGRYLMAADAAYALTTLVDSQSPAEAGDDPWAEGDTRLMIAPTAQDGADAPTLSADANRFDSDLSGPTLISVGPPPTAPELDGIPPIPEVWRRRSPPRTTCVAEAGVRLYGLRTIPLVGREAELDRIWNALRRVAEEGRSRVVLIEGVAGSGKTRLVEWICERAHEVGAATVVSTTFHPDGDPNEALVNALVRHFKCADLSRGEAKDQLRRALLRHGGVTEAELEALLDVMMGESAERAGGLDSRFAVLRRLLHLMGVERPIIAVQDDVQWAAGALAFDQRLLALREAARTPVLVLATVRSDAIAPGSKLGGQIDFLAGHTGFERLRLEPLGDAEQTRLVRELLGLQGDVVEAVVSWSGGLPQWAVQLIGSWVSQGLLVPGQGGFRLKGGRAPALPTDLQRMWVGRLTQALRGRSLTDRIALELAATLGQDVVDDLWAPLCVQVGVDPSVDLVESLVEARLARWRETGWAFVNPMLRERLMVSAKRSGRWRDHNLACARLYESVAARGHRRGLSERRSIHLLEAGKREEAFEQLVAGALERWTDGDYVAADVLIQRGERLLKLLKVPAVDRRWVELWLLRARWHNSTGAYLPAARAGQRAEGLAAKLGDSSLKARALQVRAVISCRVGQYEAAMDLFGQAQRQAEDAGAGVTLADSLLGQGEIARRWGENRRAQSFYARALGRYRAEAHVVGVAKACHCMAAVAKHSDPDQARDFYNRALHYYTRAGARDSIYACINGLAHIDRLRGDLDQAEGRYREALAFYDATGAAAGRIVRSNLAFVRLLRGHEAEAERMLLPVRAEMESGGHYDDLSGVYFTLAVCAAGRGDWPLFDTYFARAEELIAMTQTADPDDGWCALEAGKRAQKAGQSGRALRALATAEQQYRRVEHTRGLAQVRHLKAQLS